MIGYLNTVQTFVNGASNFIQNPFTTLKAFLPPEVAKVVDTVEQIGEDPEGFISDTLSNYGLSYINTALQGDIVGALIEKYGSRYSSAASPFSDIMSKASAIWDRYNADGSKLPTSFSDLVGPNLYNQGTEDLFGNPQDDGNIVKNLKSNFKTISQDLSGLPQSISKDIGGIGSGFNDFANSINPFRSKSNSSPEVDSYTDSTTLSDGTPIATPMQAPATT
jgi:phage-related protein